MGAADWPKLNEHAAHKHCDGVLFRFIRTAIAAIA